MFMDLHLDLEELRRLVQLDCSWSEAYEWLFHLMTCGTCRRRLVRDFPDGRDLLLRVFRTNDEGLLRAMEAAVEPTKRHHQVLEGLRRQGAKVVEERTLAPALIEQLSDQSPAHRRLLLMNRKRFQNLGVVLALLEEVRELWQEDPRAADSRAEDCLHLLDRLETGHYDLQLLRDTRGTAWAYWGNSRRILGDTRKAEEAFQQAGRWFHEGSDDPADRALLLSFQASLREEQERSGEALALLDEALALYHRISDRCGQFRTVIQKAHVLHVDGDYSQAIALLESLDLEAMDEERREEGVRSLERWSRAEYAQLRAIALQNLAVLLVDVGRYQRARSLLPEVRRTGQTIGRMHRLRIAWLEGRLCAQDGEPVRALRLLHQVRRVFIRQAMNLDTALVTLDLAALHLQSGRRQEARALAVEMLPLFLAQDIQREACAALMIFHRALSDDTASEVLARDISAHLRRLRHRQPTPELLH